jgi:hypothetical protein
MELDQDDMFIRDDIFQILYTEAKNKDLDLVQSRDFFKSEFAFEKKTLVNKIGLHYIHPKKSHYKEQPELFEKLFTDNNNYLLWGLLILHFPQLNKIIQSKIKNLQEVNY